MIERLARSAALLAASQITCGAVAGAPLLDTGGFESPGFSTGALGGQGGWLVGHLGFPTTSFDVQTQVVEDGSQAVRVDRAASSDGFALGRTGAQSGRYVTIDWDMRVDGVTPASQGLGPLFGIQVFDDSQGSPRQLATFGVDAAAEELLYQFGGNGNLAALQPADLGVWARYRIDLDFVDDTYSVFLNEQLLITTSFPPPFQGQADYNVSQLTDVDIVGIATGFDANSQANEGTAYFDNLLVRDGLRGDFTSDGVVDAADYTVWRTQNGTSGLGLAADGNADGVVNAQDYLVWAGEYGMTNSVSGSAIATPEPTALGMVFAVTATGWVSTRRRRRS